MKIIAQMDEISSLNIKTDSTFAMLLAAQKQGHQIYYYTPQTLTLNSANAQVTALAHKIKLENKINEHYQIIESSYTNLTEFDAILFRQDPPFNMNYLTTSYILERIKNQVLIVNNPTEIRNCPEKIFITDFPHLTPPTLITSDLVQLQNFYGEHKEIVIKPLYGAGGEGVFRVEKESKNLNVIFETILKLYQTPFIAQKYLPQISEGDKRILLLDGEIIGAVSRMAKNDEIRSNFHAGGSAKKADLSEFEIKACAEIGQHLKTRGLFFVGIDVIGNFVTEINVTSPTGIKEINAMNDTQIEYLIIEALQKKVNSFGKKNG